MQHSQEQGLIGRKLTLDELFINTEAHSGKVNYLDALPAKYQLAPTDRSRFPE